MSANTQIALAPDENLTKVLLLNDQLGSDNCQLISILESIDSISSEQSEGISDIFVKVSTLQPDVLILAVQSLAKDVIKQLAKLHEQSPLPVIVVAKEYARNVVETVVSAGVSSYLVDEVSAERLTVIIDLSIARFNMEQGLLNELQVTKERLSDRKLIERAKGIIMKQKHLTEEEAYAQMRKSAMNQGQSMADLAKRVISVFEMLD